MRKFVFPAHGEMDRTREFGQAHMRWWSSIQDHAGDAGNPLFNGRDVTADGEVSELNAETSPALGYSIVQAGSLDAAVDLLADCPMDMWVYEAMPK